MAKIGESGDLRKCSFCGHGQKQVMKLIAGPGVYICDGCVHLCCEIMDFEGLPLPRRYNASFQLENVLTGWVDGIQRQGLERTESAKMFLAGLLARLGP